MRIGWKSAILLLTPLFLGIVLGRVKVSRDRAYVPLQQIALPKLPSGGDRVRTVAFSPDGQKLALTSAHGQFIIWDLKQKKWSYQHKPLSGESALANSLQWHKEDLITTGYEACFTFSPTKGAFTLTVPTKQQRKNGSSRLSGPHQIVVSQDASTAFIAGMTATISASNLNSGALIYKIQAPSHAPYRELCGLALSKDAKVLAVASLLLQNKRLSSPNPNPIELGLPYPPQIRTEIALRDARNGKLLRTLRWDDAKFLLINGSFGRLGEMGLAFSPNGETLVGVSVDGLRAWSVKSGKVLYTASDKTTHTSGIAKSICFSPNGNLIAVVGWNNAVEVQSARTGRTLQTFHGASSIELLAFSPDSQQLAAGGASKDGNGGAQIWDVSDLG